MACRSASPADRPVYTHSVHARSSDAAARRPACGEHFADRDADRRARRWRVVLQVRQIGQSILTAFMPEARMLPLDGLRAVGIAAVILLHVGLWHGGGVGVDLFFVLSGFLITGILLDAKGA